MIRQLQYLKLIQLVFCFIYAAIIGCTQNTRHSAEYSVAMRALPDELRPHANPVNIYNMILSQLYYPLMEFDSTTRKYTSHFLDMNRTRAVDDSLRKFALCLKKNIKYSDQTLIQVADLELTIKNLQKNEVMFPIIESFSVSGDCVHLGLVKADAQFFDRLNGVASTILKTSTVQNKIPTGLGPYCVDEFTKDKIALIQCSDEVRFFQRIVYHPVSSVDEAVKLGLLDLNHLYLTDLPDSIKNSMTPITTPAQKTYVLVVNTDDLQGRLDFARCFPVEEFAMATGLLLKKVPGIIPEGIIGYDVSFDKIVRSKGMAGCNFSADGRTKKITLYNHNRSAAAKIREVFDTHHTHFPFHVEIETMEVGQFLKKIYRPGPFLAVVGIDSSGTAGAALGESSVYFEPFLRSDTAIFKLSVRGLDKELKSGIEASNAEDKKSHYRKAHEILLKSGFVIPLGQLVAISYYPKWIKNLHWTDYSLEFPRVDLMEEK